MRSILPDSVPLLACRLAFVYRLFTGNSGAPVSAIRVDDPPTLPPLTSGEFGVNEEAIVDDVSVF